MNDMTSPAPIGHNSVQFREMIDADPAIVYRDSEALEGLIAEIETEIGAAEIDLSSEKGRSAISSRSASISRRKVQITNAGKALTEEWRVKTAAVNSIKSSAEKRLDELRDLARKPLSDWEAAEKARKDRIAETIEQIDRYGVVQIDTTVAEIDHRLAWLSLLDITEETFGEFDIRARGARERVTESLTNARGRIEAADHERAELAALRAENERNAREQAAKEADERAAQAEKDRIAAAETRIQRETEERVAREKQAEFDRIRADEEAKTRAAEAEAAKARQEAERLKREEEDRVAAENARKAEDDRRAADREHRSEIMRLAKEALMEHGGVKEDAAKKIVLAIVAGSIPNTSIKF